MSFRVWMETQMQLFDKGGIVSFDFDGVLHSDVHPGTIHPIDYYTSDLTPYEAMHQKLRWEAQSHKIIVVSARDKGGKMARAAIEFCKHHNLPISQFFFTNGGQKVSILKQQKVIRHYDDDSRMANQLMGTGIEFVLVPPQTQEMVGTGLVATNKPEYDSGLNRPQYYRPLKLKKKSKIDKLFGEATKKTKPAAGIFFTDGRSVLMLKRRPPGKMPNCWGLPGGHSEGEETPFMTAQREVREECGKISGKKFGVLTSGAWTCFFYKIPKFFPCKLSEEHDAWEWVRFEDLKKIQLHPQFKKQMRRYIVFVNRHFSKC